MYVCVCVCVCVRLSLLFPLRSNSTSRPSSSTSALLPHHRHAVNELSRVHVLIRVRPLGVSLLFLKCMHIYVYMSVCASVLVCRFRGGDHHTSFFWAVSRHFWRFVSPFMCGRTWEHLFFFVWTEHVRIFVPLLCPRPRGCASYTVILPL